MPCRDCRNRRNIDLLGSSIRGLTHYASDHSKKIEKLEKEISDLNETNVILKFKIHELTLLTGKCMKKIKELEKEIEELKKDKSDEKLS